MKNALGAAAGRSDVTEACGEDGADTGRCAEHCAQTGEDTDTDRTAERTSIHPEAFLKSPAEVSCRCAAGSPTREEST